MKKVFVSFLVCLSLMVSVSFADTNGFLYLQAEKAVNGSWVAKLPCLEMTITKRPLLIDWESSLDFTMPRGGSGFNHHSVQSNLNVGVQNGNCFGTISFGIRNYLEGNDDHIPAGVECFNVVRIGVQF